MRLWIITKNLNIKFEGKEDKRKITVLLNKIKDIFVYWLPSHREARIETKKDFNGPYKAKSDRRHLEETAAWLVRAQNTGSDHGISRAYSASPLSSAGYCSWEPSCPETTGYIIPKLFALSAALKW